jgi:Zn(2)-Cys(6) binuclear cluster domain-containing protein
MDLDGREALPNASRGQFPPTASPQTGPSTSPSEPGPTTIDLLRGKRKARPHRVCQPCRLRKVKCNYESPCRTCVDRGHPELCRYEPDLAPKRVQTDVPSAASARPEDDEHWAPSKQEWYQMRQNLAAVSQSLRELRHEIGQFSASLRDHGRSSRASSPPLDPTMGDAKFDVSRGLSTSNSLTGDSVYLGANSVPAMVVALANNSNDYSVIQDIIGKSILPVFGLDNESATYPFIDLWGIPHGSFQRVELLCKLLPEADADLIQLFKKYQDTAHVIYPAVVDISLFESDLFEFLRNRRNNPLAVQADSITDQTVYGRDLHWLGLLFAILASGFQCSNYPQKERQMKSQVYGNTYQSLHFCFDPRVNSRLVCCAYECLRIINYLSRATLIDLQNLLVLGNVISNNSNAGVAWSLLGASGSDFV